MESFDFICSSCMHFNRIEGGCKAFPDGIPDYISGGEKDHIKPLPRQIGNFVFTADKDL